MSPPHPLPTTSDIPRCITALYDTPPDPTPLFPSSYTPLTHAGSGTFGDVFFCLPTPLLTLARTNLTPQADVEAACTALTTQLIAVKICHGPSIPTLRIEVAALEIIARCLPGNSADTHGNEFFCTLLTHGVCLDLSTHTDALFFSTHTLPIVCSLAELKSRFPSLPEIFSWLIYSRVDSALHWLAEVCEPRVAWGDLHAGNILIGYPFLDSEERGEMPRVKIIDFGKSFIADAEPGVEYAMRYERTLVGDCGAFLKVLGGVMDGRASNVPGCRSSLRRDGFSDMVDGSEFEQFRKAVHAALMRGQWGYKESALDLRKRFGRVAVEKLEGVQRGDKEVVRSVVMDVTRERRKGLREKIGELLVVGLVD